MDSLKLEDDGMITVDIGQASAQLDLYEINDRLYEITHQQGKTSAQMFEEILDLMEAKGLPRGSHRLADRFSRSIFDRVKKKQEADGVLPKPVSPDSTAPVL